MKQPKGLILIELIMTIVLIGIISTFTGFFIFSGINGYLRAKDITTGAIDAQRALDRISLELRHIDYFTSAPAPNISLTYRSTDSDLPGNRSFRYDSNGNVILIGPVGNEQPLLEKVNTFILAVDHADLDDGGPLNDVKSIDVEFKIDGIGIRFEARIFPRNMVQQFN